MCALSYLFFKITSYIIFSDYKFLLSLTISLHAFSLSQRLKVQHQRIHFLRLNEYDKHAIAD